MTPVQAVIFDIGNVLIEWNPERYYDRTIGQARRKALFAQVDLHAMNDRIDKGEGFKNIIYETAQQHPEWRAEIEDWHDSWGKLAGPKIPHSWRLLQALRTSKMPVFALSNFGVESYAFAKTQYDILSEFDREYISGHLRVIKPNPQIYQYVEENCDIAPEALLFIDDRADNIQAAQDRGWQTHLFEGAQRLADHLVALGLLSAEQAE